MDFDIQLFSILKTAAILAIVYLGLSVLSFFVKGLDLPVHRKTKVESWLKTAKTIFIPFAILIIFVAFILWKKQIIGIPVLIASILFYKPLVNFFQGLIIKGKPDLLIGVDLKIDNTIGIIKSWGYTELKLSTKNGIVSIPYSHIFNNGYSVLTKRNKAQIVQLHIKGASELRNKVVDRLISSPFLKLNSKVDIDSSISDDIAILAFVPRSIEYLRDIKLIVSDCGFEIQNK